ncbi:MAG: hypothetical protein ACK5HR_00325 [Mycoplasmatales bacterium]
MNILNILMITLNIKTLLFIIIAFLILNLLLEKKTYTSGNIKKLRMFQMLAIVTGIILVGLMLIIFQAGYELAIANIFRIVKIRKYHLDLLLFSIISFEFLYDFILTKRKWNMENIYAYIILYGYPVSLNILLINNNDLGGIVITILDILYMYYLYDFVTNKSNIVLM